MLEKAVSIFAGDDTLNGDLVIPGGAFSLVIFAHGSGSSRKSPRNRYVASILQEAGFATLLFDLLTSGEESLDTANAQYRFDIEFLSERLKLATDLMLSDSIVGNLPFGYFGASTGAAAALASSVNYTGRVRAVVSRGGRPDLAMNYLPNVEAPTLLIVGGRDTTVIGLNEKALKFLNADKKMEIIPGATHLFEESGAIEVVAGLASDWFMKYLTPGKLPH